MNTVLPEINISTGAGVKEPEWDRVRQEQGPGRGHTWNCGGLVLWAPSVVLFSQ